jgi:hypothetical protein
MSDLGNCKICGGDASVQYPLLPGSPCFCHDHDNPAGAGRFGADFTGPDDFDIPDEAFGPVPDGIFIDFSTLDPGQFKELRKKFTWKDRQGGLHPLVQINDAYLQNIIKFVQRKVGMLPPVEYVEGHGLVSTEQEEYRLDLLVDLLETEQRYRAQGLVKVELPSFE